MAANIGNGNALIISQKVIAKVLGIHERTVRTAIADLEVGNWLQVVKVGAGRECAYVLNDRVAWTQHRDKLKLSRFSAEVIVDADDQVAASLAKIEPLNKLPKLFPDELRMPSGKGLPPVSQPFLTGMEPDLPATIHQPLPNKRDHTER